mgnify:CR=1 FL=1
MSISLSVIGGGNMAKAIIAGAIEGSILSSSEIAVADPEDSSRQFFDHLGCSTFSTASELPKATVTLLAVKPQIFALIANEVNADVVYSIIPFDAAGTLLKFWSKK